MQSALDNNATDDYDAFVAKLDPNGAKLLYSTFLGGQADDGAAGITVDSAGNAYVAVSSNSAVGFPGAPNAARQSGIFVGKLSPQGALVYSFYHPYGSAGAIALDAAGAAYVAGLVASVNPSSAT
ncbi:MAG: SBBP repeat-containing protein [Bryobacteraceae bacterium]